MGTKNNPGKFDCYAAAKPDEPLFILLGRDDLAPFLVGIWSSMRYGDGQAAFIKFEKMIKTLLPKYEAKPDVEKASEALTCSLEMFNYQKPKS